MARGLNFRQVSTPDLGSQVVGRETFGYGCDGIERIQQNRPVFKGSLWQNIICPCGAPPTNVSRGPPDRTK